MNARRPAKQRRAVAKKQSLTSAFGKPCPYCGRPMGSGHDYRPTREHMVPKSRGARLSEANKIVVCNRCNSHKGGKDIFEYYASLVAANDRRHAHVEIVVRDLYARYSDPLEALTRPPADRTGSSEVRAASF